MRKADRWRGIFLLVALASLPIVGAAFDWPAASDSLRDLRTAYPGRNVQIVTLHVNTFAEACGLYIARDGMRLAFLETEDGLWAEGASQYAKSGDSASHGNARWSQCMDHVQPSIPPDAVSAWIVVQALRLL